MGRTQPNLLHVAAMHLMRRRGAPPRAALAVVSAEPGETGRPRQAEGNGETRAARRGKEAQERENGWGQSPPPSIRRIRFGYCPKRLFSRKRILGESEGNPLTGTDRPTRIL